jgi:ADP-ribose pyrophosphatase
MTNPYRTVASRQIYESLRFKVREDRVLFPGGQEGPFAVIDVRTGIAALAINDRSEVYLVREWKHAVARPAIEVVCGGIDHGESPREAARRELREEAGVSADNWLDAGVFDPMTTFVSAPSHFYIATGLTVAEPSPEPWEVLERIKVPLDDAVEMIVRGEITHTASATLIFLAARLVSTGRLRL